jgi:hypothetical protein
MSDYIKRGDFKAAMADAGVRGTNVTAEQWLEVWTGYGHRRMDTFKAVVSGVPDLVAALRDKLRGHKAREREAKASLVELDAMRRDALALGADDVVRRLARQRGRLQSMARFIPADYEPAVGPLRPRRDPARPIPRQP